MGEEEKGGIVLGLVKWGGGGGRMVVGCEGYVG